MERTSRALMVFLFLVVAITAGEIRAGLLQEPVASPARVLPMQNFAMDAKESGRPASVPLSWGHLAAIHSLGNGNHVLVFEAESGDLRFVRLVLRGEYLYLDTRDQGGVVTVLGRN